MHHSLETISNAVINWCVARQLPYDIVCDEYDLQGILLIRCSQAQLQQLLKQLQPQLQQVHLQLKHVRSGVILLISVRALAEAEWARIAETIDLGGTPVRSYAARISAIFDGPAPSPTQTPPVPIKQALHESARKLAEAQHKPPTRSASRSQSTAQFRSSINNTDSGKRPGSGSNATQTPGQSSNRPSFGGRRGVSENFSRRLQQVLDQSPLVTLLEQCLLELAEAPQAPPTPGGATGLQGMGAEQQPADLFQRFAQALSTLGSQMNLGPLQELLKQQGIKWKKAEDGQALIFFVTNAQTKAPQPIARVGAQTLAKPQEFQKQLAAMLDFAKGQAPGTEQQKYDEAQAAQKQLRDIANQLAPQQPEQQPNPAMMAPGMGGQAPQMPTGPTKGTAAATAARPMKPVG